MVEIIDDINMPKPYRQRGPRGMKWPFDQLEMGQGFIVPRKEAEWSEGRMHDGTIKRFSSVHKQASYYGKKLGKRFQTVTNEDRSVSVKRIH